MLRSSLSVLILLLAASPGFAGIRCEKSDRTHGRVACTAAALYDGSADFCRTPEGACTLMVRGDFSLVRTLEFLELSEVGESSSKALFLVSVPETSFEYDAPAGCLRLDVQETRATVRPCTRGAASAFGERSLPVGDEATIQVGTRSIEVRFREIETHRVPDFEDAVAITAWKP